MPAGKKFRHTPGDCWRNSREPISLINLSDIKKNSTEDSLKCQLTKHKPKAKRHIFLVRHGQYQINAETDSEKVLTELGREQASLTGQRLAALGYKYDHIIYSTLTRAKETSEIIGRHLDGVQRTGSDLLQEGYPICPDPPESRWIPDLFYFEAGPRIEAAFRNFIHRADPDQKEDSYEIIVCHDNVIRYLVCRSLQLPPEAWLRMDLHHGSITELQIRPNGNVSLRKLGDAGYMPAKTLSS
ncbi:serine/threonine-protein phosphatase PGAM5, mitochondrial-like [Hyperolius riggenbachi]|uniref:serine/threonine-protein phosphatase PGAM5, mitochondrial-like n=1 Tax=Hyperolius riggenbachi TaxID=752182 RepID=UPI0035A2A9FA